MPVGVPLVRLLLTILPLPPAPPLCLSRFEEGQPARQPWAPPLAVILPLFVRLLVDRYKEPPAPDAPLPSWVLVVALVLHPAVPG